MARSQRPKRKQSVRQEHAKVQPTRRTTPRAFPQQVHHELETEMRMVEDALEKAVARSRKSRLVAAGAAAYAERSRSLDSHEAARMPELLRSALRAGGLAPSAGEFEALLALLAMMSAAAVNEWLESARATPEMLSKALFCAAAVRCAEHPEALVAVSHGAALLPRLRSTARVYLCGPECPASSSTHGAALLPRLASTARVRGFDRILETEMRMIEDALEKPAAQSRNSRLCASDAAADAERSRSLDSHECSLEC